MKSTAIRPRLLQGRTLKLLLLACLCFSVHAMAIGGRGGGGGRGGFGGGRGGEGAHFGGEESGFGRGGERSEVGVTRDGFGNRLPGAVTADEEGGKVTGHDYDPRGVDLTEQAIHPNEYAVTSGGHLAGWQSASDAQVSAAARYRAHSTRTFLILVGFAVLGIVVSMFAFR